VVAAVTAANKAPPLCSVFKAAALFPDQPVTDLLTRAYPYAAAGRVAETKDRWSAAVASREAFQRTCRELGMTASTNKKKRIDCAPAGSYEWDRAEPMPDEPCNVQLHFRSLQPSTSVGRLERSSDCFGAEWRKPDNRRRSRANLW